MREIIKDGNTDKFDSHCENCGCDFTFQIEDISFEKSDTNYVYGLVRCPFCGRSRFLSENESKIVLVKR